MHQPDVRVRGFQIHTLHPIEGYFAFIEPGPGATNDAHRIIDWVIKNRGNYVQWFPLDNIQEQDQHDKWQPFTRELIDYAHARGVRVGVELELFGNSNLQHAFDFVDTDDQSVADSIAQRMPMVTKDLPFDTYDLSFGEFFGADPQKFIDSVNEFARQLKLDAPQAEMHALVHVGATQRVDYMGQNILYYFLVKYVDPFVIPDIHTVMYFNLYDDAGGAYQHSDFSEHRQYLLDRMCAGLPAAYHPEDAYWVAFDNSVPTYMPVYVYSRWRDLDGLAKAGCGHLDNQLLFTTGWEWGYWLNDVTAMRAAYELKPYYNLIADAFGPDLGSATQRITSLADEQKRALIDQHLAGYMASRDVIIDAGDKFDPPIISQPRRVLFEEVMAPGFDTDAFQANVLAPLASHANDLADAEQDIDALDLADSRWSRELRDGIAIDRVRAEFILALYRAVVAKTQGVSGQTQFDRAQALLDDARKIVDARHADLHDTHGRRLVDRTPNLTQYQYGYLYNADTLCYWHRELLQVGAILGSTTTDPPGCLF